MIESGLEARNKYMQIKWFSPCTCQGKPHY